MPFLQGIFFNTNNSERPRRIRDTATARLVEDAGWVVFGLAALFAVTVLVMSPNGFDLRVYLEAAREVADGRSPYAPPGSERCRTGCFLYPPPVTLLFVPLVGIPSPVATWAGIAFLGGATAVLGTIVCARSPRSLRPWAATSMVLFFPLLLDVSVVNLDTLTATLALIAWRSRDRPARGGIVLAGAVGLKLVAAPIVLFYVAAGRWRQLAWAAAAAVLVAVMTAPWAGPYWGDFVAAASERSLGFVGIRPEALRSSAAYIALAGAGIATLLAAGIVARRSRARADDLHALALASAPLLAYGITYPFLVLALPLLVATMGALASRPALLALPFGAWLAMEMPLGLEPWRFGGYVATVALGAILFLPAVSPVPQNARP